MKYGLMHSADGETTVVHEQTWAAYLLAWTAAFSDAVGFLILQQLGASYMSGNSMVTGVALGQGNWTSVLNHALPILSFVVGLTLGILVIMQVRYWGIRFPFAVVFGLEVICLLTCLLIGNSSLQKGIIPPSEAGAFYLCTILISLPMGLQTATLDKIGGQGVRTTFVTGVLSDLMHSFTQYVSWLPVQSTERNFRKAVHESMQQTSFRHILLLAGIWGCYIVGAACGSVLELHLSMTALVFPLCVLVALIVIDIVRPFDRQHKPS